MIGCLLTQSMCYCPRDLGPGVVVLGGKCWLIFCPSLDFFGIEYTLWSLVSD